MCHMHVQTDKHTDKILKILDSCFFITVNDFFVKLIYRHTFLMFYYITDIHVLSDRLEIYNIVHIMLSSQRNSCLTHTHRKTLILNCMHHKYKNLWDLP